MKVLWLKTFLQYLDQEQKEEAVTYALDLLKNKLVSIQELYMGLLSPALTSFVCKDEDHDICIWKEHERTSTIRTILEASFPFVIEQKKLVPQKEKQIVVLCPSEEFHEIGAIMVTHFFLLQGYQAKYIGANTPKDNILSAIAAFHPDYVAFSVTDYYNLVVTKKITEAMKAKYPNVKIILGGQAFMQNGALEQVPHDIYLSSIDDIARMEEMLK